MSTATHDSLKEFLTYDGSKKRFKWNGDKDNLKEFWIKIIENDDECKLINAYSNGSTETLKFENKTVNFYPSTKTLQIQGAGREACTNTLLDIINGNQSDNSGKTDTETDPMAKEDETEAVLHDDHDKLTRPHAQIFSPAKQETMSHLKEIVSNLEGSFTEFKMNTELKLQENIMMLNQNSHHFNKITQLENALKAAKVTFHDELFNLSQNHQKAQEEQNKSFQQKLQNQKAFFKEKIVKLEETVLFLQRENESLKAETAALSSKSTIVTTNTETTQEGQENIVHQDIAIKNYFSALETPEAEVHEEDTFLDETNDDIEVMENVLTTNGTAKNKGSRSH